MPNVFLTGPVQVGKSTVVDRVVERLGWKAGGVRTVRTARGGGEAAFLLIDCMSGERFEFARRGPGGTEVHVEVFETAGTTAVRRAVEGADLIVLDELGRMELGARAFQREVLAALESVKPVLGVIKPERNPFLDSVRAHPQVEILGVTEETRDHLVQTVLERLRADAKGGPA